MGTTIVSIHTVRFLKMGDRYGNYFFPMNDSKQGSRTNAGFFFALIVRIRLNKLLVLLLN